MEVVISKSTNKNKKFDAIVDGKKYHLVIIAMKTLQCIKMKNVNRIIFPDILKKIIVNQI